MIFRNLLSFITDFFKDKKQFIFILIVWITAGRYLGFASSYIALGTFFVLKANKRYEEIFFAFFILLYLSDSYWFPFIFSQFAKGYYLFLMALFLLNAKEDFPEKSKFSNAFIPFFAVAIFVIPRSEVMNLCIQKTLSYFLMLYVVPTYVLKIYKERGPMFFKMFLQMMGIILIIAIVFYRFNWTPVGGGRFKGFFGSSNGLGLHCTTFFLLFMVVKHYYPKLFTRIEVIIFYLVIGFAAIKCGSRNCLMSILIFIAFYRFYKISPLLGFVTVIMVALSYNFIMDNYIEFIHNIGLGHFLREGTLKEGSGRYVAWDFAIEHIKENPYFGKGFVHEEYIYYAHGAQKRLNMLGHEGCSHNSYLAQTLNTGLIGAGLFFGAFIVKFMNASKKSIIAMPVLYSILFAANFEAFWIASLNPYTILIIVTATILTENEFNSEEKKATFSLL